MAAIKDPENTLVMDMTQGKVVIALRPDRDGRVEVGAEAEDRPDVAGAVRPPGGDEHRPEAEDRADQGERRQQVQRDEPVVEAHPQVACVESAMSAWMSEVSWVMSWRSKAST